MKPLCAGLLLTGGASRRMGTPKALIEIDGETSADRSAGRLSSVCDPCIEVGPGYSRLPSRREAPPGGGPLAALAAGWEALTAEGHRGPVIVLAVDLPLVTVSLLRLLQSLAAGDAAVIPLAGDRPQPLTAAYPSAALAITLALLRSGERSMHALVDAVAVRWLAPAEWAAVAPPNVFLDIDTPADLLALLNSG